MQEKINYNQVGARIRAEREMLGLSREKLSELINISPYFLGQIERGQRRMSLTTLADISDCLHVSLDHLLFESVDPADQLKKGQLNALIEKCSPRELELIRDLINLILPHIGQRK